MARWRGEIETDAIDLRAVVDSIPALLDRLRRLRFVDGVAVDPFNGSLVPGLRNVTRDHPSIGARYEVDIVEPLPTQEARAALAAGKPLNVPGVGLVDARDPRAARFVEALEAGRADRSVDELTIEVVDDDRRRLSLRGQSRDPDAPPIGWQIEILTPSAPTRAHLAIVTDVGAHWFVRGRLTGDLTVALDRRLGANHRPSVQARVQHRRVVAKLAASAEPIGAHGWRVSFAVSGRMRGILRPLAALVWLLSRGKAHRKLDDALAQLPDLVRRANDRLTRLTTGDALADELLRMIFASVAAPKAG